MAGRIPDAAVRNPVEQSDGYNTGQLLSLLYLDVGLRRSRRSGRGGGMAMKANHRLPQLLSLGVDFRLGADFLQANFAVTNFPPSLGASDSNDLVAHLCWNSFLRRLGVFHTIPARGGFAANPIRDVGAETWP
jgi:hypothetical protein